MNSSLMIAFQQLRKINGEQEQAIIRVLFSTFIFFFLLSHFNAGNHSSTNDIVLGFSAGFLIFSILLLIVVYLKPAPSEKRQFLAICSDIGAVTFGMFMTAEIGTLFYGIYLWVIVGNGLRYGIKSLVKIGRAHV